MARPVSTVFSINGKGPSEFKLPEVHASDPLNLPLFPSIDYFQRPDDIVAGQKITMRLNPEGGLYGQVFGYVAPFRQCILDMDGPDTCWMVPPSPTNYEYAHQGSTILADASTIPTANIGGAGGHAPHALGWSAVPRFYEDISTQMARVRYGADEYGVWAAGIGVATLTWGGAVTMVASATSGDWRWVDELGSWDFMGSCFVNLPGLPLHAKSGTRIARRASATPSEDQKAMIITMSGDLALDDAEDTDMGASNAKPCNCSTAVDAAQTAAPESVIEAAAPGLSPEDIDARIASALEANNAAWQERIDTAVNNAIEPIITRLSPLEARELSILDQG